MKSYCIIVAAGIGKRMGPGRRKPFRLINNIPILIHTLRKVSASAIDNIILVVERTKVKASLELIKKYKIRKIHAVISGGRTRSRSVYNAVKILPLECAIVLIHDGVRPFVSKDLILKIINNTKKYGACIPGIKAIQTIKQTTSSGFVKATIDRGTIWHIQTPQGFKKNIIVNAYEKFKNKLDCGITDDSMLVEMLGKRIKVIEGETGNIKITTKYDLK